jgi:hypothetical protein
MAIEGSEVPCEVERTDGLASRLSAWAVRLAGRLVGMLVFSLFSLVFDAQGNEVASLELL